MNDVADKKGSSIAAWHENSKYLRAEVEFILCFLDHFVQKDIALMFGFLCLATFFAILFRFQCVVDMVFDKIVDSSNGLKPDRVSVQEFESAQAYSISQSFHNIIERLDKEVPFFSWHRQ